jgi:hypothetical protein
MAEAMRVILAEGICKNISCEEVHALIDRIYADFKKEG